MAAGCPAILSDRCGNWGYSDTVQHRYNGLVYPCGDVDALAEAILALTAAETRTTYSQHAKEVFSKQDLNCELNAFLNLIERIQQQTQATHAGVNSVLPQQSAVPVKSR